MGIGLSLCVLVGVCMLLICSLTCMREYVLIPFVYESKGKDDMI